MEEEYQKPENETKNPIQDKERLQQRVFHLEKMTQEYQEEIRRLQIEKREIERSSNTLISDNISTQKRLESERDALRKEVELQRDESERLISEIQGLERSNEESLEEVRELRRERDGLLEEKTERERRVDSMADDSSSIIASLLVSNTDLVERMERKTIAEEEEKYKKREAFSLMKSTLKKIRNLVDIRRNTT